MIKSVVKGMVAFGFHFSKKPQEIKVFHDVIKHTKRYQTMLV